MGWQDAVAITIVSGAAGYLLSIVARGILAGKRGLGCGTCPARKGQKGAPHVEGNLIEISALKASAINPPR